MAKIAKKTKTGDAATKAKALTTIKGFDHDLKCRGFQFEVGKTYDVKGEIKACVNGFHAVSVDDHFHVWDFYPIIDAEGRLTRYAMTEQSGAMSEEKTEKGTKIASATISIKMELSLPEFIKNAVTRIVDLTKGKAAGATSNSARIGSSGDSARIGSSGDSARIGSSGDSARIGSSGNSARIGSSGYSARIGSSGDYAQIGSSGYSARIGSSGYYAQIGSSGNSAQIGSSGNSAQIGSSGDSAQIGSSGDYAQIGSSGNSAQINSTGRAAVIAAAGPGTTVSGVDGAWISLAEFVDGKCVGFATGCIGQDGLKENTAYRAQDGKLVAVK